MRSVAYRASNIDICAVAEVADRRAFAADDGRGQRQAATALTVFQFPNADEENVPKARREFCPPAIQSR
jgi:hypothetical protein